MDGLGQGEDQQRRGFRYQVGCLPALLTLGIFMDFGNTGGLREIVAAAVDGGRYERAWCNCDYRCLWLIATEHEVNWRRFSCNKWKIFWFLHNL